MKNKDLEIIQKQKEIFWKKHDFHLSYMIEDIEKKLSNKPRKPKFFLKNRIKIFKNHLKGKGIEPNVLYIYDIVKLKEAYSRYVINDQEIDFSFVTPNWNDTNEILWAFVLNKFIDYCKKRIKDFKKIKN